MTAVAQAIELFEKTGRPYKGVLIAPPDDPGGSTAAPATAPKGSYCTAWAATPTASYAGLSRRTRTRRWPKC
jgi:hypothetical protein